MTRMQRLRLDRLQTIPQIRERFDETAIRELATSFEQVGQLFPIRVRMDDEVFIVVDGERRVRAARFLNWPEIDAIIEEKPLSQAEVIQRQYIANCQRENLTGMERARAMQALLDHTGWKLNELATRLGISPAAASRSLALLKLPPEIQQQVADGRIPESAAYQLTSVKDPAEQQVLAQELTAGRLTRDRLNGRLKAQRTANQTTATKPTRRLTAHLEGGRSVTVNGTIADIEALITLLEDLLGKCRKARGTGVAVGTFVQMLKEQADAATGS